MRQAMGYDNLQLSMSKALSFGLLACGMLFVFLGIDSSGNLSGEITQFSAGSPVDDGLAMFIGGIAATAAGFAGLLRRRNTGRWMSGDF
jgi:hypothetical protein